MSDDSVKKRRMKRLEGALKDISGLIQRAHDSGDLVDGGQLRYWVQLIEFALKHDPKQTHHQE